MPVRGEEAHAAGRAHLPGDLLTGHLVDAIGCNLILQRNGRKISNAGIHRYNGIS